MINFEIKAPDYYNGELKRLKIDLPKILERDVMDNDYILHELNIRDACVKLKRSWNIIVDMTELKVLSNLLSLLSNNEYISRITNNCEEYDKDPFAFEETKEENDIYLESYNFLNAPVEHNLNAQQEIGFDNEENMLGSDNEENMLGSDIEENQNQE